MKKKTDNSELGDMFGEAKTSVDKNCFWSRIQKYGKIHC